MSPGTGLRVHFDSYHSESDLYGVRALQGAEKVEHLGLGLGSC